MDTSEKEALEVIKEWNESKDRDILLVTKLREVCINNIELAMILKIIESTCHYCWDGDRNCQCWNDE